MINFSLKKRRNRIKVDSSYLKNFSVALLNWERNRQEDKFGFRRFDVGMLKKTNPGF
jgi:hypothetical protein